jgi:hypothetical protein
MRIRQKRIEKVRKHQPDPNHNAMKGNCTMATENTIAIDDATLLGEVIELLEERQAAAPECDAGWYQNAIAAVKRADAAREEMEALEEVF